MRRNNAPTLQDVAGEAGVTAMVASVVLNGARSSTRVSEATRARILEAAARLKYRRNAVAHGLSHSRMNALGVVSIIDGGEINLYFLEVLNGILEAAVEHGQNTTVFSLSDWEGDESRILEYCDGRVDGMILIAPQLSAPFIESLPQHTPFVCMHGNGVLANIYNLDIDNEGGAYALVRYLISQGHRRIMHFPGGQDLDGPQQRIAGYRRALEEAGIPYDDALVLPGHFSFDSGRIRATELLNQRRFDPLPTAIFCASDAIAYGCMEVFARYGIHVPDDISITGFDDTFTARMTVPPLTTVRQPFRQMGRRAVELLLSQIREQGTGEQWSVVSDQCSETAENRAEGTEEEMGQGGGSSHVEIFPVQLVIRGSVGPPSNQPLIPAYLDKSKIKLV